jgi:hypothetical protein
LIVLAYNAENFWGLPTIVKEIFEGRNINKFYPWQIECLSMKEMLHHKSVLCGLPTSGGKVCSFYTLSQYNLFEFLCLKVNNFRL